MANAIAYAPATAANLGVGFDILGLALESPGDVVRAELRDDPGVIIVNITGDGGKLPREATQNTAGVAAQSVLNLIGTNQGIALSIEKRLPLGSGLGSSAASAVAGALAANALFGNPLTQAQLLTPSLDGEAVASGRHPDNVGPSLFGGITLFSGPSAELMTRLPVPENLFLALVTPDVVVKTADARAVLPKDVPMKSMIQLTAAVAKLVDGLYRSDICAVGHAMEQDCVVEPAREYLMPYFRTVREAAHYAGAYGLVISGAGPTLMAVCDTEQSAATVADAMHNVYREQGIKAVSHYGQVNRKGAHIVTDENQL